MTSSKRLIPSLCCRSSSSKSCKKMLKKFNKNKNIYFLEFLQQLLYLIFLLLVLLACTFQICLILTPCVWILFASPSIRHVNDLIPLLTLHSHLVVSLLLVHSHFLLDYNVNNNKLLLIEEIKIKINLLPLLLCSFDNNISRCSRCLINSFCTSASSANDFRSSASLEYL